MKKDNLDYKSINEVTFYGKRILKILFFLLIIVGIYSIVLINKEWKIIGFILNIIKVISPLFFGLLIAYLLNPLIVRMTRRKLSRGLSTSIVYIVFLILLYLFGSYLIPSLGKEVNDLIKSLPSVIDSLNIYINNIINKLNFSEVTQKDLTLNIKTVLNDYLINMTTNIPSQAITFLSKFISKMGTLLISLIISFYLLIDFDRAIENVYLFIPKKYRKNTHILLSNISEQIFSYVKGTGLITLVVFIVSFLSFSITGLRGALFLALWNAITNIIPYVGPYIGGIPIILFAFTTDYRMGIIILIIVILIQLIESYILHPIVMSKTMKLHPVTIIISLIIFGHYFGIIGMLIATPVTAIIKTIWLFLDEKYRITEKISKE